MIVEREKAAIKARSGYIGYKNLSSYVCISLNQSRSTRRCEDEFLITYGSVNSAGKEKPLTNVPYEAVRIEHTTK